MRLPGGTLLLRLDRRVYPELRRLQRRNLPLRREPCLRRFVQDIMRRSLQLRVDGELHPQLL